MAELDPLEIRLRTLGAAIEFPPTPGLAARVRARLQPRAWYRRPSGLAAAAALVTALLAGSLAVTPVRDTVAGWLGIRHVVIQRVPHNPSPPPSASPPDLGQPITLAQARAAVAYHLYVPSTLGQPSEVGYSSELPGGLISLSYGPAVVLVQEFGGRFEGGFLNKSVGPGSTITPVSVGGTQGYFIAGAPHQLFVTDSRGQVVQASNRLAGNVLIWQRGDVVIRVEGDLTQDQALAVGRSMS